MFKITKMSYFLTSMLLVFSFCLQAQLDPVSWSVASEKISDNEYQLTFTAEAESAWYVYSQTLGEFGPIPTSFMLDVDGKGMTHIMFEEPEGINVYDELFDMEIKKFKGGAIFTKNIQVESDQKSLQANVTYMTCDDKRCLPPQEVRFEINLQ